MSHLRPYCLRNAILEAFIRPAIGAPRASHLPRRAFVTSHVQKQKLSRKQREAGAELTPEDKARIAKAQAKAAQKAQKQAVPLRQGNSAERLIESLKRQRIIPNKDAAEESKEERAPQNAEIRALTEDGRIDLIDLDQKYTKNVYLEDVLQDMDHSEETLILVRRNPPANPVCKLFTQEHIQAKKRRVQGRMADLAKGERSSKEVELTWTIGPADLDMKCRQIVKFLEEGRKLDVTIARRWRRKVPEKTEDELKGLVETIREAAKSVKGARETKTAEGQLAGTYELQFEGPKGGIKERSDAKEEDAEDLPEPSIAGAAAS